MQPVSRKTHVLHAACFIQPCQYPGYLVGVRARDPSTVIVKEELTEPFVPEVLDHGSILPESGDAVKQCFTRHMSLRLCSVDES